MAKALILSADSWSMTDEKTQKPLSGTSVWYINDYREDSAESRGYKPTKVGVADDKKAVLEAIREAKVALPAIFELDFDTRPGAQGKPALVLVSAKHLKNVDVFPQAK